MNSFMKSLPSTLARHPGSRGMRCLGGAVFVVVALLAASCKRSETAANPTTAVGKDPVAIQIGKREIRLSELQAEIDFLRQKHNPAAASLEAFLDPCVERLVALERARELGLDQDIELKRQWENLLVGRLRETEIEAKLRDVAVTDEEIREYYERNLRAYTRPAQLQLALLYLSVPARADDEARAAVRQRMEEARKLALDLPANTRGFGGQAMTYSEEATSRFKGGDIGWLDAGAPAYRWPDEVMKAGFALAQKGDLSDVIETADGFYLLKKLDSREAVVRSLEGRMRATLENSLLNEKRAAIETQLKQSWKSSNTVTVHEDILNSLEFQHSTDHSGEPDKIPTKP